MDRGVPGEQRGRVAIADPGVIFDARRHGDLPFTDQWLKVTLSPVERIMSLDFVPATGGLVT